MSIEVGSKWVKDGEEVKVIYVGKVSLLGAEVETIIGDIVIFCSKINKTIMRILSDYDFLEQYKPYEPVYEYQYVLRNYIDCPIYESQRYYKDDNELLEKEVNCKNFKTYQRLDFTKRERT